MRDVSHLGNMTASQARQMRLYYYAKVTHVDRGVGMVIDALKAKGLMDNTWIIYTSDHGEMLGDHRCSHKGLFYESALNIPLCVRPPGGMTHWKSRALTDHLDLTETMLEIADASTLQEGKECRSSLLSKIINGPEGESAQEGKQHVFSDIRLYSMVRNDRFKLVADSLTRDPTELYDMSTDPNQLNNLVENSEVRRIATELIEPLNAHLDKLDHEKVKKYQDALGENPNLGSAADRMGVPTINTEEQHE